MKILISIALVVIVAAVIVISGVLPGHDGILATRKLPDGTVLLVAQKQSTSDLGYEVGFYFKEPSKPWGWCYLAHDDTAWQHGSIRIDPESNIVTIW